MKRCFEDTVEILSPRMRASQSVGSSAPDPTAQGKGFE